MRIDLETIKKIEYYLTNNMSVIEKKMFEQEMEGNEQLREAVMEQKNLTMAMEKSTIKSMAVNAGIKYRRNLMIKYVAGVCTVVVLLVGGYFVYDGLSNTKNMNEDALVENVVPSTGENSPLQNVVTSAATDSLSSGQTYQIPLIEKGINHVKKDVLIIDSLPDKVFTSHLPDTFTITNKTNDDTDVKVDSLLKDIQPNADNGKIYDHFVKESEFFTVSVNKDIKIKGIEGTRITIPKGSLVDSHGDAVEGTVTIQLIEFYKKSDMIFGNLHTQANGELLESGGMIYISAMQKDEELFIASDKKISIQFTGKELKDSMLLFNAVAGNDKLDWKLNDYYQTKTDTVYSKTKWRGGKHHKYGTSREVKNHKGKKDLEMNVYTYNPGFDNLILQTNQLGWINCDRFSDHKNNTSLSVTYDAGYTPVVRLVFPLINSMMASISANDLETQFINIPIGMQVYIIAFAMVDDVPYYFTKRITVTANQVEHIDLQKTTLDQLEIDIKKFDASGRSNDFQLMN